MLYFLLVLRGGGSLNYPSLVSVCVCVCVCVCVKVIAFGIFVLGTPIDRTLGTFLDTEPFYIKTR